VKNAVTLIAELIRNFFRARLISCSKRSHTGSTPLPRGVIHPMPAIARFMPRIYASESTRSSAEAEGVRKNRAQNRGLRFVRYNV